MRILIATLLSVSLLGCNPDNNESEHKPSKEVKSQPDNNIAILLTDEEWMEGWEVWSNSMLGQPPHIVVRREPFPEAHHVSLVSQVVSGEDGKKILEVRVEEAVGINTEDVLRIDFDCNPDEFSKVVIILPNGKELEFNDFMRTE